MPNSTPGVTSAQVREQSSPRKAPAREIQELWFALARRDWRSVVLVPADAGESTNALARALADVAKWLHEEAITLVLMSDPLDYACASQIVGPLDPMSPNARQTDGTVIMAVQPIVVEPLGLSVMEGADATIICVEMGHTRTSSLRRTVNMIGRERIAGSFLSERRITGR
jgi:hypothetical protein